MLQLIQHTCGLTMSNKTALPTTQNLSYAILPCSSAKHLLSLPKSRKIIYPDIADAHGVHNKNC